MQSKIWSIKSILFFDVKDSNNGDRPQIKNHWRSWKLEIIDGAEQVENMQSTDIINKVLLSFIKESISL